MGTGCCSGRLSPRTRTPGSTATPRPTRLPWSGHSPPGRRVPARAPHTRAVGPPPVPALRQAALQRTRGAAAGGVRLSPRAGGGEGCLRTQRVCTACDTHALSPSLRDRLEPLFQPVFAHYVLTDLEGGELRAHLRWLSAADAHFGADPSQAELPTRRDACLSAVRLPAAAPCPATAPLTPRRADGASGARRGRSRQGHRPALSGGGAVDSPEGTRLLAAAGQRGDGPRAPRRWSLVVAPGAGLWEAVRRRADSRPLVLTP